MSGNGWGTMVVLPKEHMFLGKTIISCCWFGEGAKKMIILFKEGSVP
jgi:hypothetical protein